MNDKLSHLLQLVKVLTVLFRDQIGTKTENY